MERIINASSNDGDIVLDPFCGCGTAIIASHKHNRRWVGIDINKEAWDTIQNRASQPSFYQWLNSFKEASYISRDLNEVLEMNPKQFEDWANEYYRATKPHPDGGVDGITQDGIAIQTKTFQVGYEIIDKLLSSSKFHPLVPRPIKKLIFVSQVGYDDNARKRQFEIQTADRIEVVLATPEDMLKVVNPSMQENPLVPCLSNT